MSNNNPIPPEGCICSSFWTVRQSHKNDCPLNNSKGGESARFNSQELEDQVNRLVGMAVLKNDKNYAWDILELFTEALDRAELEGRLDELNQVSSCETYARQDIYIKGRLATLSTKKNVKS